MIYDGCRLDETVRISIIGIRPLQRPSCWRQRLGIYVWDSLNSVGSSTAGLSTQPSRGGISI